MSIAPSPCWAAGRDSSRTRLALCGTFWNAAVAESGAVYCSRRPGRAIVSTMPHYLGIDAGGSQTTCAIGDGQTVHGRSHGAACKLSKVGEKQAREVLQSLIQECCKTAGIKASNIEHTCMGVAGISGQKVTESMRAMLSEIVSGEIKIVGDMMIALEAAFAGEPG